MGKMSAAIDIAKKIFGKKKPKVPEKVKTDTSKYPTTKNIDDLIAKEQDPFVRNKLISMKKSRARGDVKDKGGNIMGTPNKERSAEAITRYVTGAKDGGRIGKKFGGGTKKNSKRMNDLEELGRVNSEKAYSSKGKRNLKAEKKRIVKSLNSRGAAKRGHGAEIR